MEVPSISLFLFKFGKSQAHVSYKQVSYKIKKVYLTSYDTTKNGRVENDGPSTECIRRVAREETREDAAQIKESLRQIFERLSIANEVPLGDESVVAWDRVCPIISGAISVASRD